MDPCPWSWRTWGFPTLESEAFPLIPCWASWWLCFQMHPNAVSIFVDPTSKVVGPSSSMSSEKRLSFELLVVVVVGQKAPFIPQGLWLDNADFWWVSYVGVSEMPMDCHHFPQSNGHNLWYSARLVKPMWVSATTRLGLSENSRTSMFLRMEIAILCNFTIVYLNPPLFETDPNIILSVLVISPLSYL